MTSGKETLYEWGAHSFAAIAMVGALVTAAGLGGLLQTSRDQVRAEETNSAAMAPGLEHDHELHVGITASGGIGFLAGYMGFAVLRGMQHRRRSEQQKPER